MATIWPKGPRWKNEQGGPLSMTARQLNRHDTETLLESESSVMNVWSFRVKVPLVNLGPCLRNEMRVDTLVMGQQHLRGMIVGY